MSSPAPEFAGTERFRVEKKLGAGAFGTVYRVYDSKMRSSVALKSLRTADPSRVYRFKQEFRSLADITHRNLVTLYEMLGEGDHWFFTMELIDGVKFLDYVHGESEADVGGEATETIVPTLDSGSLSGSGAVTMDADLPRRAPLPAAALDRLRSSFAQLAEGLVAIHQAGILHRDIKPSNVLVASDGRVVVLDFGLVTQLAPDGIALDEGVAGTPAYMSPEQASARPVGQPSDWFGVGVMLYQALTGVLPFPKRRLSYAFDPNAYRMLRQPSHLVTDLPPDLNRLCMDLLRMDPAQRPSGLEVLRRLGGGGGDSTPTPARASVFVGRQMHLATLDGALRATQQGRAIAVEVRGRSGMGKSAIVRRFLDDVRARHPDAVILSGRCYQNESVPYKALDSLVDTLSEYLQRIPHQEAERLMPRDVASLARLFPVLRRVEAVIEARNRGAEIHDSQELRRRGFAALRDLLGKLAETCPLVMFIDDLQWGDLDSARPLAEILREPGSPAVLWIGSYRSEEAEASPLLRELAPVLHAGGSLVMQVDELTPEESHELAVSLVGPDSSARAQSIVDEAHGNPFFIELLRESGSGGLTLDDVIHDRVRRLPDAARRLLEVVAVAGQPVPEDLARRAADFTAPDLSLLNALRTWRMLRGRDAGDRGELETYHDRIRETVLAHLDASTSRTLHLRLAHGYESSGRHVDPETLVVHYERGGEKPKAAVYAAAAARQAADALAFDRAARLYRLSLDLDRGTPDHARGLSIRLGDALANAARGDQAARAYLDAAEGALAAEALDLRRRASEQLLLSGHIDEGLAAIRGVLASVGMKMADTPRGALASLLFRRAQVRLRGIRFRERDASQIAPSDLVRIDACWTVGAGLALVDNIYAADFQARSLLLALKAGEPYRVARALGMEAGHSGTAGGPARRRCEQLLAAAKATASRVQNPYVHAHIGFMAGMVAFCQGRWGEARELLEAAEAMRAGQLAPTTWESTTARMVALITYGFRGELRGLADRYPALLKDVRERGDLYTETGITNRISHMIWLSEDKPEQAAEELRRAIDGWSHKGFHFQHYWNLFAQAEVLLYRDEGRAGWSLLKENWAAVERSMMLRVQLIRTEIVHARARCALAMGDLKEAERDTRSIEKVRMPWTDPLAGLLRAGIAAVRGDPKQADRRLEEAARAFEACEMALYAAAARRARGLVTGDRAAVAAADQWMADQGVRNPAHMMRMLAPGRWT